MTPSDASARCDATSTWCRNSASSTNGTCCASIWDAATDVRARSTSLTPRSSKRSMTLMMKMAIAESAMLARATPTLRENSVSRRFAEEVDPGGERADSLDVLLPIRGLVGLGDREPRDPKDLQDPLDLDARALGDLPCGEPPERPAQQERGEGAQLAVAVRRHEIVERRAERREVPEQLPPLGIGRVGVEEPRGLPGLLVGVASHRGSR